MSVQYQVGQLVKVDKRFCNHETTGYIYEQYQDFNDAENYGVGIILKDGKNLGGFSFREQQDYLEFVSDTGFAYQFENVMKLHQDYQAGLFEMFFELNTLSGGNSE